MGFRRFFLSFLLSAYFLFDVSTSSSSSLACNSNDLKALTGLSNCLGSLIAGWNSVASPDCCNWTGVTCDSSIVSGRRVVGLELGSRKLKGKICESLADLDQLRFLSLSHNFLSSSLPDDLFRLQNLEIINISSNDLLGLSTELQNLRELHIQDNRFSGPLKNGIANLSNLVKLDISSNLFSVILPDAFGSLTRLEQFSASSNLFIGRLPRSVVNSPSLQMLVLKNNSLSGLINLSCSAMNLSQSWLLGNEQAVEIIERLGGVKPGVDTLIWLPNSNGEHTNNVAEVLSILHGLRTVDLMGFRKVEIEMDSKLVVEWMKRSRGLWYLKDFWKKILYRREGIQYSINHTFREFNAVADDLAKMGAKGLNKLWGQL
ncbi:phytosulfokine receptor 1-like [Carya illinoinensis]|uniref:phytosulfokine receptor 1-like n=1 Tax=Carya illinoinensis TaxID=32201 RepID=UPI001C724B4C|nr:phytosulfokine receptor 1-like [Carya illinoinensis]